MRSVTKRSRSWSETLSVTEAPTDALMSCETTEESDEDAIIDNTRGACGYDRGWSPDFFHQVKIASKPWRFITFSLRLRVAYSHGGTGLPCPQEYKVNPQHFDSRELAGGWIQRSKCAVQKFGRDQNGERCHRGIEYWYSEWANNEREVIGKGRDTHEKVGRCNSVIADMRAGAVGRQQQWMWTNLRRQQAI